MLCYIKRFGVVMNILIVDDEVQLCSALSQILKLNKYNVTCCYDGEEGLDYALTSNFDLFIIDVMMPKIDGFTLVKEIRNAKLDTPILMLTAKSDTQDKIYGLNAGADDYISKPFSTDELLARIKALLRRRANYVSDDLTFLDLTLNRDEFTISCNENKIALGKKEFQIMEILMLAGGKNVDKNKLIDKIWGYDSDAEYNAIEVYVSFLRRKLEAIKSKVTIKSIRGVGYNLNGND